MNTDFKKISFKGQVFDEKSAEKSNTKEWMKMKISKESTSAMKTFYLKHMAENYPFYVNWFVLGGIWLNQQLRCLKVKLRNFL